MKGFYKAYRSMKNTITATYATSVKGDVALRTHGTSSKALEAALHHNGVPVAVYEQLIEAVHEKLPVLRKYLDIRKRVLGGYCRDVRSVCADRDDCDIPYAV
ncbi:MAG: hypothetical protein R2912_06140 [Eubacteriales bacterium]